MTNMAVKPVHIDKLQADTIHTINMAQKQEFIEKHLPVITLMINTEAKQEVLRQTQMV